MSLLHAAAFRLLGPSVLTLRLTLWALFVAAVPALYYVCTRLTRPWAAAGVTALAFVWGVPLYMSAMPSWYNTLFALVGLAALFAHRETGRARWLFAAGLCGGLSMLAKISGLYFVAAGLLVIVHRAQEGAAASSPPAASARATTGLTGYRLFITASLVVFAVAVLLLVRERLAGSELFHVVIPAAALAGYLVRREWSTQAGVSGRARAAAFVGMLGPFLVGVATPLALFASLYGGPGELEAVVRGVLLAPSQRFDIAQLAFPPLRRGLIGVPLAIMLWPARRAASWRTTVLAVALAAVCWMWGMRPVLFAAPLQSFVPLLTVAAVWTLSRATPELDAARRDRLFALAAVAALCSFIQFPYAALIYFCYVAPLVALLGLGLFAGRATVVRGAPALVGAFFAGFAVLDFEPYPRAALAEGRLGLDRAGVVVGEADRRTYEALGSAVARLTRPGDYLFAGPECPEVNFLTATRNPTPYIYSDRGPAETQTARTLAALRRHQVRVVAINHRPMHFGPPAADLVGELRARYPHAQAIGKYELRWRD